MAVDRLGMSPSRYLGLPWRPWGDTDDWLTQAYERYRVLLCSCGSGQFRADCLDENLAAAMKDPNWRAVRFTGREERV